MKYTVRYMDWGVFYTEFAEIFLERIYHFQSKDFSPLVIDCGSHIGMSIIYFKHIYPEAKVIGFEPAPSAFEILKENISKNNLDNVQLVNAALSATSGNMEFISERLDGSHLAKWKHKTLSNNIRKCIVKSTKLSDYLTEPVDFLKIDVEGAEHEILMDIVDKLHLVKKMVVEYHGFPDLQPTLPSLLELLTQKGFKYVICSRYISPPLYQRINEHNLLFVYAYRDGAL